MARFKVGSVEEAVLMAEQMNSQGRTCWFRGQAQDWPVCSSFVRGKPQERERSLEKVARYEHWVKTTPGLENLASNTDSAIAVAQHYGLPTNFVDFTDQPGIAGFFASEKAGPQTAQHLACIVILDIEDLKEFWQALPPERYPPPEFLEMDVPDLWRLEAQHGSFLYCPYGNIEQLYDFDRILFPNTHVFQGIRREDVYPQNKSHLEILLDQYFMNELLIVGTRSLDMTVFRPIVFQTPEGQCDPDVFPAGLPDHESWSEAALRPWLAPPAEKFHEVSSGIEFRIKVRHPRDVGQVAGEVQEQLLQELFELSGIRHKLVAWEVDIMGENALPANFSSLLGPRVARLWDGLRSLPYSDEDVCAGLGMCVGLGIALGGDFRNPDSTHWERAAQKCLGDAIELEFGADDGSYSRASVSTQSIAAAIRGDILTHVSDGWKAEMGRDPRGILQTAWSPKKTCDFGLLTPLFAREVAPYQVLARETAVFYSPARLASLGLP